LKRKTAYVYLTGGLGNQLFQLSAALSRNKKKIVLDPSLGKPRTSGGMPDLMGFVLPKEVIVLQSQSKFLFSKVAGYLLRMGVEPRGPERLSIVKFSLKFIGSMMLSLHFRRVLPITLGSGVGFSNLKSKDNEILIGYFQSYKYLFESGVIDKLKSLIPVVETNQLANRLEEAVKEKPIFVHYRLGDYLAEKHFGTPNENYYLKALTKLEASKRNIWVFSDDLALAKDRFPRKFLERARFIDDGGLTPAQILHLFRFGSDYVIANSSFSWWGAILSMSRDCKVIAPYPWFAGMPEPQYLVPKEWQRMNARG
jgi:hypothetical protein